MPFFNYALKEIHCKVVYCGPGMSGKTTNLEMLYARAKAEAKGQMISLKTESDRTLFFDFVPLSLGKIRGFQVRFHIYSVPGQVFYAATRRLIMKGLDGAVFVADSHESRWDANEESFEDFVVNLADDGHTLESIPYVLQCNKRDAVDATPMETMEAALNPYGAPCVPAIATTGEGVATTLKMIAKHVLKRVKTSAGA